MLNIVFLGTPEFAVKPLQALIAEKHNIVAVVSQPDREKNRKGELLFTPIKKFAFENGLKVLQFEKIRRDGVDSLKALNADLFVTCAYGQILSREILDIPRFGVFNIHASLLPKYRGAAPVQWAIIRGEKQTGITIMKTDEGVDTGDIILTSKLDIKENENSGELLGRLSELGAQSVLEAVKKLEDGTISYTKQDNSQSSHYPMLRKTDGEIDFSQTSEQINNRIRGLNPAPCCYAYLDSLILKIHKAEVVSNDTLNSNIGEIVVSDVKKGLYVACGKGVLRLCEIQLSGGKKMPDTEFLKGKKIPVGSILTPQL